jgi:hypothetical protein
MFNIDFLIFADQSLIYSAGCTNGNVLSIGILTLLRVWSLVDEGVLQLDTNLTECNTAIPLLHSSQGCKDSYFSYSQKEYTLLQFLDLHF